MTQTIRINGQEVPVDQFDGPSEEQRIRAQKRFHVRQANSFYEDGAGLTEEALAERRVGAGCGLQGGGGAFAGTPRLAKFKQVVGGVRVK